MHASGQKASLVKQSKETNLVHQIWSNRPLRHNSNPFQLYVYVCGTNIKKVAVLRAESGYNKFISSKLHVYIVSGIVSWSKSGAFKCCLHEAINI